jgi:hypothetical protein
MSNNDPVRGLKEIPFVDSWFWVKCAEEIVASVFGQTLKSILFRGFLGAVQK